MRSPARRCKQAVTEYPVVNRSTALNPISHHRYWSSHTSMKHQVLCTQYLHVSVYVSALAFFSKLRHIMVPASFSDDVVEFPGFIQCTSFELWVGFYRNGETPSPGVHLALSCLKHSDWYMGRGTRSSCETFPSTMKCSEKTMRSERKIWYA